MLRIVLLLLLLLGCTTKSSQGSKTTSRMQKGVNFIKHQCSDSYLRSETVFHSLEGEQDIKQWYSFFFSSMNTGSWITETNEFDMKPQWPYIPDSVQIRHDGSAFDCSQRYCIHISIDVESGYVFIEASDTLNQFTDIIDSVSFPFE